MLTSDQIAALRDKATELTDPVLEFLLEDITRRICEAGKLTATASYQIWRAQQLGMSQREVKQELKRRLKVSNRRLRQLLTVGAEAGYNYDIRRFPYVQAVPFYQNDALQQILQSAVQMAGEEMENLTQTIGMVDPYGNALPLQDVYRSCCDYAFRLTTTGAADYNTAIRRATKNLAEKGLRVIDYESGVHTSMEAAVRRCVMGAMGLVQEQISQQNHDDFGCDGWEISAHAASAPDHEPIQGKQYSDAAYTALNNSLLRRIGTLNCGHVAFPIIMGVTPPQYTPEELEKFRTDNEKGVTMDGKHYTQYEATQLQRKIERAMRRQKNRILVDETAGDKDKLLTDQIKLQRLRQEYARVSDAAGLRTQHERAEVAGFDWKKVREAEKAGQAIRANTEKSVAKGDGGDILGEQDVHALYRYMSSESYALNAALRSPEQYTLTTEQQELISALDAALEKLPDYSGTVYRSISTDMVNREEFMAQYVVGVPTYHPAYTSTAKTVYDESMGVQLVIEIKHGKDISAWNKSEQEVLLKRGTWLIPTHIDGNTIYLEEM